LAEDFTSGAVVYVSSKEDMVAKMEYYLANPAELAKKQEQGYEWCRKFGTNRLSIQRFLYAIKAQFNDEFLSILVDDTLPLTLSPTTSLLSVKQSVKPVVSVNIMGGLGNQLFQIAAAYSYARQNGAQLQLFNKKDNGNRSLYWDTIFSSLAPYLVDSLPALKHWRETLPTMYTPIPAIDEHGLYLNGYLQTSKYHIKDEIKQSFKVDLSPKLLDKYSYLLSNKEHVVVMHSRQTDYVKHREFHGPLTIEYYKEALGRMTETVKHPFLVLCGDDNTFWKNMEIEYPHIILEDSDINTFALLQQFHYFIMSNSTFIWWCVYLANTKKAFVPAKWFGPAGPSPYEDIYEDEWERIA
jgi:hypothetical protein